MGRLGPLQMEYNLKNAFLDFRRDSRFETT